MVNSKIVGLIGYGSFGKLTAAHISRYAPTLIYSPSLKPSSKLPKNCHYASLKELAAKSDLVILAVNLDELELVLKTIAPLLKPTCLVVDVCSVKVKPAELMQKYLPKTVQILATHPLFGPQSASEEQNGLAGHTIVVYPIRIKNFTLIKLFLSQKLKLKVVEMSPKEHDKQMALIHGLTFFLARGLMKMNLSTTGLNTPSYKKLLSLAELEKHHSKELFKTIESGNPYAAEIRQKMIKVLTKLHEQTLNSKH